MSHKSDNVTPLSDIGKSDPIAIVGMAVRLPGGIRNTEDFWNLMIEKRSGLIPIPKERWNTEGFYSPVPKWGTVQNKEAYMFSQADNDLTKFDASYFTCGEKEVERMDPMQRQLLEIARECLDNAGETGWWGQEIGCYVGNFSSDWQDDLSMDPHASGLYRGSGYLDFLQPNRISYEYGWTGPSGKCKTFDLLADGYGRGEAVNAVYVKRLSDALRDGNPVRAIIRASATNNDGRSNGIMSPNTFLQEALIRKTYEKACLPFNKTAFFECHGTGTPTGDPLEVAAVARIWKDNDGIMIGAVKPNVGHSEGAAGLTSVIKAVLALENRIILDSYEGWQKFRDDASSISSDSGVEQHKQYLDEKRSDVDDLAYTLGYHRDHLSCRAYAIVNEEGLLNPSSFKRKPMVPRHLILVFTGQGVHWAGMGKALIESNNVFRNTILNLDVWLQSLPKDHRPSWTLEKELSIDDASSKVGQRGYSHPCATAVQIALVDVLASLGIRPDAVTGHSGGEAAAAYAAGSISAKAAMAVAYFRGWLLLHGARVLEGNDIEPAWRNMLDLKEVPWLMDHIVDGHIVFPGACYMAMAGEAMHQIANGQNSYTIRDMSITTGMTVPKEKKLELYTRLIPEGKSSSEGQWYDFKIMSCDSNHWVSHCSGYIRSGAEADKTKITKDHAEQNFAREIEAEAWYRAVKTVGIEWQTAFQGLDEITVSPVSREATATVYDFDDTTQYAAHPTLLDQMLQINLVAQTHGQKRNLDSILLPTFISRLGVLGNQDLRMRTYGSIEAGPDGITANAAIYTEDGRPTVYLEGLSYSELPVAKREEVLLGSTFEWKKDITMVDSISQIASKNSTHAEDLRQVIELLCFKVPDAKVIEIGSGATDTTCMALETLHPAQHKRFYSSYTYVCTSEEQVEGVRDATVGSRIIIHSHDSAMDVDDNFDKVTQRLQSLGYTLHSKTSSGLVLAEPIKRADLDTNIKVTILAHDSLEGSAVANAVQSYFSSRGYMTKIAGNTVYDLEPKTFRPFMNSLCNLRGSLIWVIPSVHGVCKDARPAMIQGTARTIRMENKADVTIMEVDDQSISRKGLPNALYHICQSLPNRRKGGDLDADHDYAIMDGSIYIPRQANYSASNTYLDAFVEYRHHLGLPASIIDLGVVGDVGYLLERHDLYESFRNGGFFFLKEQDVLDSAAIAVSNSFGGPYSSFCLGGLSEKPLSDPTNRVNWKRDIRFAQSHYFHKSKIATVAEENNSEKADTFVSLARSDPTALRDGATVMGLAKFISATLSQLMLRPVEDFPLTESLTSIGLDSIISIELVDWIHQQFCIGLTSMEVTQCTSLVHLAEKIIGELISAA
ncbi:hypothetical protein EsH8_V_001128 [Colletotrichum jinshuiense]